MEYIVIEDLCKSYGTHEVLRNFSAKIPVGRITALKAPSGKGKTTLIRILMGLERADSGRILGMEGLRISAVFQEDRLCENLSVYANLRLVSDRSEEEIRSALHALSLSHSVRQKAAELSGGMKRRVAILRALLADYDMLFLDEPLSGLDKELKDRVIACILEQTKGKTLLLITHNEEEERAFRVVHRIRLEEVL
ncbi:MAG: ATP-binding cassette domain-containing protein [Peptostreptococcaceae bacterium]|nr:ATP-binding cassette domain-containing protein [Peptostreptococcaceae bacterium]